MNQPPDYEMQLALTVDWGAEIIPNFTLSEIACNCGCGLILIQPQLLLIEHIVRQEFGEPIYVSSWTRCLYWNEHEGGKKYSFHRFGKAIDQRPLYGPITPRFIAICQKHFPFVAVYDWGLHCDIRGKRSINF